MDSTNNSSIEEGREDAPMVWTLTGIYGNPTVENVQRLYREVGVGTVVYAIHRWWGRRGSNPQLPTVDEILQTPHRYTESVMESLYGLWKFTDVHYHTTQYQREVEPLFLQFPPTDRRIFDRLTSEYTRFKGTMDYEFVMGTLRSHANNAV